MLAMVVNHGRKQFFGTGGGLCAFIDMAMRHLSNPKENAYQTEVLYSGDQEGAVATDMRNMDHTGYLMVHSVKQFPT